MAEIAEIADFGDFLGAVDIADAIPVDSFIEISSDAFNFGSEYLSMLPEFGEAGVGIWDQIGSFAGDANFINLTDPGSITRSLSTITDIDPTLGGAFTEVNGLLVSTADLQAESFSNIFSGVKESLGIPTELGGSFGGDLLTKAGSVFDDITTTVSKQFTPAVINRTVTDFAVQTGRQVAGQVISQVVPPALQPYANQVVNTATRSISGTVPPAGTIGTPGFGGPLLPSTVSTGAAPVSNSPGFFDSLRNIINPVSSSSPGAVTPSGPAYDDNGVLNLGWTTREDGTPVFVGGGFNDATGQYLDTAAPILDPYYGLSNAQLQALGNADPTDPYIRARLGIPQLPDSPLNTSDVGLNSLPGAVGNIFSSVTTAGSNLIQSLFPGAATVPGASNDPDAIAAAARVRSATPGTVTDPNLAVPPLSTVAAAVLGSIPGGTAAANAVADREARAQGLLRQAQNQATARVQSNTKAATGDWRVRLQLAASSTYLYNAPDCGPVLWPLRDTNGIIFPYTPAIDTAYKANYTPYDLTHSNYRGYFYQSSYVDSINIKGTFTAQDTVEANYLLAVIHFFRSVTKMFYGQDAQRGSPPPLVFLSGLGDYQFNQHPCLVSNFNYSLPSDVDYIRAQSTLSNGGNQLAARTRQTTLGNPIASTIARLASLGQAIQPGAVTAPFAPQGSLAAGNPTYVPTKMEINLSLLPVQTRSQVSQQFSVKGFANGNLLKGGFW
jgi:hypothetical protein